MSAERCDESRPHSPEGDVAERDDPRQPITVQAPRARLPKLRLSRDQPGSIPKLGNRHVRRNCAARLRAVLPSSPAGLHFVGQVLNGLHHTELANAVALDRDRRRPAMERKPITGGARELWRG